MATTKKRGRPRKKKTVEVSVPKTDRILKGKEEFLSPADVQRIKNQIAMLDMELGDVARVKAGGGILHPERMFAQDPDYGKVKYERRATLQKILETKAPPEKVKAPTKNAAYTKMKELGKEISDAMQSRDVMMGKRLKNPVGKESREPLPGAVDREVAFQEKYSDKIREYQRLAGIVDPHNPELRNIERLRREH